MQVRQPYSHVVEVATQKHLVGTIRVVFAAVAHVRVALPEHRFAQTRRGFTAVRTAATRVAVSAGLVAGAELLTEVVALWQAHIRCHAAVQEAPTRATAQYLHATAVVHGARALVMAGRNVHGLMFRSQVRRGCQCTAPLHNTYESAFRVLLGHRELGHGHRPRWGSAGRCKTPQRVAQTTQAVQMTQAVHMTQAVQTGSCMATQSSESGERVLLREYVMRLLNLRTSPLVRRLAAHFDSGMNLSQ